MTTRQTPRQLARERITADITDEARRQLADHGASALSLRSVARELGMVSSAVYRYVASRDDLLTRLIVEGYNSLGDVVEAAVESSRGDAPSERWVLAAHAVRGWALDHPHEYSLLYGSPVPGYSAPQATAGPGVRPALALIRVVAEAKTARQLHRPRRSSAAPIGAELAADFALLRESIAEYSSIDLRVSDDTVLDILIGWTQLFGLLSFEVTNQTRGIVTHHREMFDAAARRMAAQIGLA